MSDAERAAILKVALLLAVLEGWTAPAMIAGRLGLDTRAPLAWLTQNGYVSRGPDVVRWSFERAYEQLWRGLIPERPCPVRLCSKPRAAHAQELR